MNRARIAVVALIALSGLAGCAFFTGLPGSHGSAGRTVPMGPSSTGPGRLCGACGPGPARSHRPWVLAGGGALTDNVNDSYVAYGVAIVSSKESEVAIPVPAGGTLSNLEVRVTTATGTGASWTLTVRKNKSPNSLTCSVAGLATSCSDYSAVDVVAGDTLDLGVKPFGRPELATITWSATLMPERGRHEHS